VTRRASSQATGGVAGAFRRGRLAALAHAFVCLVVATSCASRPQKHEAAAVNATSAANTSVASAPRRGSVLTDALDSVFPVLISDGLVGNAWSFEKPNQLVTAEHVIPRDREADVRIAVGTRLLHVEAIQRFPECDLALLQLSEPVGTPLVTAKSATIVGDTEYVAATLSGGERVVIGSIAGTSGFLVAGAQFFYTLVRYGSIAAITGTSGAPWLNSAGEVVGVMSGNLTPKDRASRWAYYVPIRSLRQVLSDDGPATPLGLDLGGEVHAYWYSPDWLEARPAVPGVLVGFVTESGALARIGLASGDLIESVDGVTVTTAASLCRALLTTIKSGATHAELVVRDRESFDQSYELRLPLSLLDSRGE